MKWLGSKVLLVIALMHFSQLSSITKFAFFGKREQNFFTVMGVLPEKIGNNILHSTVFMLYMLYMHVLLVPTSAYYQFIHT